MNTSKPLISKNVMANADKFWETINLLLTYPHVLNRQILASRELLLYELQNNNLQNILEWLFLKKNDLSEETIEKEITIYFKHGSFVKKHFVDDDKIYLRVARLLPRNLDKFPESLEFTILEMESNSITFFYRQWNVIDNVSSMNNFVLYKICYKNFNVAIEVENTSSRKTNEWLKNHLFIKILKWLENESKQNVFTSRSLNLIEIEKYQILYSKLKNKYGKSLIQNWSENTDPQKYVYEDIAISTYILLIWQSEREKLRTDKLQSFVDLGCGNGLLVYILSNEGHDGLGIDVRRRKIWKTYPDTTKLEVWN